MELTLKEATSRAGNATLKKYGKENYSKLGKKGNVKKLEKYGEEYMTITQPMRMMIGRWRNGRIPRESLDKYLTNKGVDPATIAE